MTAFPTPPKPPVIKPRLFGFRTRLYLTWAALLCLFASFFLSFDLKFSIILDKLPNLVGLHLAPNGFLQGAALTLFLCLCSIVISSVLGFVTALGRLSKSAVAFGIASFYASFFRGTPLLIQILLIYLGLPQLGLELVTESMRPLHTGDFGGLWVKLIWFFFGLILSMMILSGLLIWTKRTALATANALKRSEKSQRKPAATQTVTAHSQQPEEANV